MTAKKLINHYFNVSSFITTIYSANMNPSVLQCKNCWKWGIQPLHADFKMLGAWNAMVLTKSNITVTLLHVARLISRSTLLISKPNRANLAFILSNTSIARATTKQTPISVCSGAIVLTKSGIYKNTRNSRIPEPNQFIQL